MSNLGASDTAGDFKAMRTMRQSFDNFCCHLTDDGGIDEKSKEFAALDSNLKRVDFTLELCRQYQTKSVWLDVGKNPNTSEKLRKEGNTRFLGKKDDEALSLYNSSIAAAPLGTEHFALGYANRSAVLMELGRYKECLADIEQALKNKYPTNLMPKLLSRKSNADILITNQKLVNLHESIPELKNGRNPSITCASASLKITTDNLFGRHVVAAEDINVGDVLAAETPYALVTTENSRMSHCHHCLQLCFNIVPCQGCVACIYCKESCRSDAWEKYHKFECGIMTALLSLSVSKLTHLALKVAIQAKTDYKNLTSFQNSNSVYESDRYEEIHNLTGNTELRTMSDLFYRAYEAAVLYQLVKEKTNLLETKEEEDVFKEILMHHLQTGPSNFHEITDLAQMDKGSYLSQEIGAGAYSFLSLLNHSCSPNVVRHCYGSTIVLRALRPISAGGQLFDNYGYHFAVHKLKERQLKLKEQYHFSCACDACTKNWPRIYEMDAKGLEETNEGCSDGFMEKLKKCDLNEAKAKIASLEGLAQRFNGEYPCKELCRLQEAIKQSYAIFGSKRIYSLKKIPW